jgi:ubiquinone/menaquinone biosynthesis C-methylase UbiE
MKRTKCSACDSSDLEQFLDLGMSPIADAYLTAPGDASPKFPLQVVTCAKCRLVQLLEVVDAQTLFGTGYSFYSSASKPLVVYHHHYAQDVIAAWSHLKSQGVLEIGCNDGDFLRHFAQYGYPHLGVDPAEGPTSAARKRGLNVITASFDDTLASELLTQRGQFGIIIANHVLAHVESVTNIFAGIKTLLTPNGIATVEVQYLPDMLINNSFDLVYHEHRNFFSLTSLEAAANRWDLHVIDAELTDRQGGSLRVTLGQQPQVNIRVNRIRDSEVWLQSFGAYEGMQGRAERIRDRLRDLITDVKRTRTMIIGYGAPAKATTLFSFCDISVSDVAYMIDTTPAKQNRFMPGSAIPIVASHYPTHMPAAYLVTAWNYIAQIIQQEQRFTTEGGQWIIPFPAPILL